MQTIYRVRSTEKLHPSDPLHVGHFYPNIARRHNKKMQDRQDLILYLAGIHKAAIKSNQPNGFCRIPMRLMTLRDWVYDYKTVFDHFFTIVQHGYNLGEKNDISTVIPKKLRDVEVTRRTLVYAPPERPKGDFAESTVYVRNSMRDHILEKLRQSGRLDLHAPVEWILQMPIIKVLFGRSGKLQLRDTSVWPVSAMETWPAWLREDLFGPGIDIESAYTQFLIENLRKTYDTVSIKFYFPDLLRSLEDKAKWRNEICTDILGLEQTSDNISLVKKICMSLANGSRISPAIMLGGISVTKDIIIQRTGDVTPSNLIRIGERLSKISKQYSHARKIICNLEIGLNPTRVNQKRVFQSYFAWERTARYKIWEAVGKHGIMVHDGIDGIPSEYLKDIPGLVKSLDLRLT